MGWQHAAVPCLVVQLTRDTYPGAQGQSPYHWHITKPEQTSWVTMIPSLIIEVLMGLLASGEELNPFFTRDVISTSTCCSFMFIFKQVWGTSLVHGEHCWVTKNCELTFSTMPKSSSSSQAHHGDDVQDVTLPSLWHRFIRLLPVPTMRFDLKKLCQQVCMCQHFRIGSYVNGPINFWRSFCLLIVFMTCKTQGPLCFF